MARTIELVSYSHFVGLFKIILDYYQIELKYCETNCEIKLLWKIVKTNFR